MQNIFFGHLIFLLIVNFSISTFITNLWGFWRIENKGNEVILKVKRFSF